MENSTQECPFKIGDKVKFTPSERTKGQYQNIEGFGLEENKDYIIREIKDSIYLYFDDGKGGFPWNEFKSSN